RAGQHVDIRLTAEDGYQAERSYSIASGPDDGRLELTVERIDDGEVSPYLVDEVRDGDSFELRGPIGGYFAWDPAEGGPLLLVGVRGARPSGGAHQDGTFRTEREVNVEELDGNGAAGRLSEVFALEVTAARGQCGACGNVAALAEARAFVDAPGLVIRCRSCD